MGLINRILSSAEFINKPPVLIDIGASGGIHKKWKKLAPFATCIAFDADERDFDPDSTEKDFYKKLLIKKSLVSDKAGNAANFYLTASPHCSSLLQPDMDSLIDWAYSPIFSVEKVVQLDTTDIISTLSDFGVSYIDWYKSDSQGIDLKLFKSIPDTMRDQIILAEFEPGILDAYLHEDKLSEMLSYHDGLKKFWLADLIVKGPLRIPNASLSKVIGNSFLQKVLGKVGQTSPGWAEMTYCNSFKDPCMQSKRSIMMGWVAATLIKQYGFAYTLADMGMHKFEDPLFQTMKRSSARKLWASFLSFRYLTMILKKFF